MNFAASSTYCMRKWSSFLWILMIITLKIIKFEEIFKTEFFQGNVYIIQEKKIKSVNVHGWNIYNTNSYV